MLTLEGNSQLIVLLMAILGATTLASAFLAVGRFIHLYRYWSTPFLALVFLSLAAIGLGFAFVAGQARAVDNFLLVIIVVVSFCVLVLANVGYAIASAIEIARVLLIRARSRKSK